MRRFISEALIDIPFWPILDIYVQRKRGVTMRSQIKGIYVTCSEILGEFFYVDSTADWEYVKISDRMIR